MRSLIARSSGGPDRDPAPRLARAARPQALQNLDRGGFAGAIRTQQSEHFAGAHFKIDAAHRLESSVKLAKTAYGNDRTVTGSRCTQSNSRSRTALYSQPNKAITESRYIQTSNAITAPMLP